MSNGFHSDGYGSKGLVLAAGLVLSAALVESSVGAAEIRSHRGNLWGHPEHTLESYDAVIKAGAQVIEIDVQLSLERIPICLHDATLDRTTTGAGFCAAQSLAEIKSADAGADYGPVFAGRRVPTLEEALLFLKGRRAKLFIEPKVEAAAEIEAAIAAANYPLDRVSLLNSTAAARGAYSAINPHRPFWLICGGTPSAFGSDGLSELKASGWDGLSFWPNLFTPKDFVMAHRAGLRVGVYGVSAENVMTYVDQGADLLLTDNPGGLPTSLMDGYVKGVWDQFAATHALPPSLSGHDVDADKDGLSNLEELAYGTSPLNPDVIPPKWIPLMRTARPPDHREIVLSVALPVRELECFWFSVLVSFDGVTWSTATEPLVREDNTAWPADGAWHFRIQIGDAQSLALYRVKPHFFPRP